MTTGYLGREAIRNRTEALPLACGDEDTEIVSDRRSVSAFFEQLRQEGSSIPDHLIDLAHQLTAEEYERLGPDVPEVILRSIIARALQTGAAQALSETGSSALEARRLEELVSTDEVAPPGIDS